MKVKYSELFPEEFNIRLKNNPLAFLPLGSLEYHGYHNVLGLDTLKAERLCELAAKRVGGIVFPGLSIGFDAWPDIDMNKYPNKRFDCYHIDKDVYAQLLNNYIYRIQRIGFKKVFILAGHYPNAVIAREALNGISNIKIYIYTEAELLANESGDHAGKWETSLMMYLFPELVDLSLMDNKTDRLMAIDGIDPIESSKEFGKQKTEEILDAIDKLMK